MIARCDRVDARCHLSSVKYGTRSGTVEDATDKLKASELRVEETYENWISLKKEYLRKYYLPNSNA